MPTIIFSYLLSEYAALEFKIHNFKQAPSTVADVAMKVLFQIKFIDRQRFIEDWPIIDDSGDSSSSLPSREAIEVVVGSYSSVLNLGEKEASCFPLSFLVL